MNYKNQRELTEKMLFDYHMISSRRESDVFSPIPYYLESGDFETLRQCGEIIDKLVTKIMCGINGEHRNFQKYMDDFPYKEAILSLKRSMPPIFWTRYDGFLKEGGGVFFSEFNYDKPCAQREILFSSKFDIEGNPNLEFEDKFIGGLEKIIEAYIQANTNINLAVLMDPCHYEEHHLSHLFTDILQRDNLKVIPVGPKNFYIKEDTVWAFDKKIDIILRLFPTEFLYEVKDFEEIIKLYDKGKVLLLNDPRVIVCQAKSIFAYLWELAESNSEVLTEDEHWAVRESIPYTTLFSRESIKELITNKDKYVIKSVFGRYSSEVYIGVMHSDSEWEEVIDYVLESPKLHIVQQFCKIKRDVSYKAVSLDSYAPIQCFGNFGVYMIDESFAGICIRWAEDYLTDDETTWITPVGVKDKPFRIMNFSGEEQRKSLWKKIYERAMFEHDFTGGYTGRWEYFSIDPIIIKKDLESEIETASNNICEILKKVQGLVQENSEIMLPLLSIEESLEELVKQKFTNALCAVGRLDWIVTDEGNLKLLEFNSETPAGLVESTVLSKLIKEEVDIPYRSPDEKLAKRLRDNMVRIIEDYKKVKDIKTIGFLTATYYEDWYNTSIIYDLIKDLPYDIIIGNIEDARVKDGAVYLYGKKMDCVYRYYPLDWFCEEEKRGFIEAFKKETLSINPPHTLITQSKAIFIIIYELLKQGFFNEDEMNCIKKYMPETHFSPEKLSSKDYCIKPLLGREGEGVRFKYELRDLPEGDLIYQERLNLQYINVKRYHSLGCEEGVLYPILGAFIVDDKYSGIYTRAGDKVTDRWAHYIPVYIEEV